MTQNASMLAPPLPGYEHINRFWNKVEKTVMAKILPGEFYITDCDEQVSTVLGSCIAACVRDFASGIGGMNHFMLPEVTQERIDQGCAQVIGTATRYGNYAMEHLINAILSHGGRRVNLEFKIFGGGRIIPSMGDVGERNIRFVMDYLALEHYEVAARDLGGIWPRKIIYSPQTGRVRLKKLEHLHNNTVVDRELNYQDSIKDVPVESEIELFE